MAKKYGREVVRHHSIAITDAMDYVLDQIRDTQGRLASYNLDSDFHFVILEQAILAFADELRDRRPGIVPWPPRFEVSFDGPARERAWEVERDQVHAVLARAEAMAKAEPMA